MKSQHQKSLAFFSSFIIALVVLSSCKKEYSAEDVPIPPVVKNHNILLRFKPMIDTNELVFGNNYKNFFKESYTVSAFKFYVHGIELINTDSNRIFRINADKYYLVDFKDSNSTKIELSVQPYLYNRISFVIGVDSSRNVSGAQTGALDPAKGMFWTWNTGYIMAKLEGTSPVAAGGRYEYHIGGFSGADNVIRKPFLLFPFGQIIDLKPEKSTEIVVTANANSWFYNPHDIKLSENPVVNSSGPIAKQVSENYSKMFTVISIINE